MGLNDTPSGERVHIGFFGKRNAGKSSIVNAVTGQDLAVVSDIKGTTTDPVYKAMELLPLGPVMIIDTPGIDDRGSLGQMRVKKTRQILNRADIAILITDATQPLAPEEKQLISLFREKMLPYLIVRNKWDFPDHLPLEEDHEIRASALTGEGIHELKERIAHLARSGDKEKKLVGDLIHPSDTVILVVPIDKSAPKGRLILPQQQTIRDILDSGAAAMVVRETEYSDFLDRMKEKPALVITDSQVFSRVSSETPEDIPLTSFSILMARYKGFLDTAVHGVSAINNLKPGDRVLIAEGCTHHRQCEDIGTVKIPAWLNKKLGFQVRIDTSSGREFPDDLSGYSLVIHCGGCMLNEREMLYRMKCAQDQNIPFTNYGVCIAWLKGILERSIRIIPNLHI